MFGASGTFASLPRTCSHLGKADIDRPDRGAGHGALIMTNLDSLLYLLSLYSTSSFGSDIPRRIEYYYKCKPVT